MSAWDSERSIYMLDAMLVATERIVGHTLGHEEKMVAAIGFQIGLRLSEPYADAARAGFDRIVDAEVISNLCDVVEVIEATSP